MKKVARLRFRKNDTWRFHKVSAKSATKPAAVNPEAGCLKGLAAGVGYLQDNVAVAHVCGAEEATGLPKSSSGRVSSRQFESAARRLNWPCWLREGTAMLEDHVTSHHGALTFQNKSSCLVWRFPPPPLLRSLRISYDTISWVFFSTWRETY